MQHATVRKLGLSMQETCSNYKPLRKPGGGKVSPLSLTSCTALERPRINSIIQCNQLSLTEIYLEIQLNSPNKLDQMLLVTLLPSMSGCTNLKTLHIHINSYLDDIKFTDEFLAQSKLDAPEQALLLYPQLKTLNLKVCDFPKMAQHILSTLRSPLLSFLKLHIQEMYDCELITPTLIAFFHYHGPTLQTLRLKLGSDIEGGEKIRSSELLELAKEAGAQFTNLQDLKINCIDR